MAAPAGPADPNVVQIFKEKYGNIHWLNLSNEMLSRDIPFEQKDMIGGSFRETFVLTNECGITFSNATGVYTINSAISGVVQESLITASSSILASVLPFTMVSRSAGAGPKAFIEATKYVVKNNLDSHEKYMEGIRFHGQADYLLGYVSYATQTYRNVAFTNGTGTLNGVAFSQGVKQNGDGTSYILLAPGYFAAGLWVSFENTLIFQVDSTGATQASGNLISVYPEFGYIKVNFNAVAATSTTSSRLCWQDMQTTGLVGSGTAIGIAKILSTQTGTIFGVDVGKYSLYRGTIQNMNGQKLTLDAINLAVAQMYNKGSGKVDLTLYVNPRSWRTITSNEAALRKYDYSYDPKKAMNGFEAIEYVSQNGRIIIKSNPYVMEGQAFALYLPSWTRSGSAQISMKVPGSPMDIIYVQPGATGWVFQSYADEFIFPRKPVANIYFYNINDESLI